MLVAHLQARFFGPVLPVSRLLLYPAGFFSTQGLQERTRDQAELHRRPREMSGCA